MYTKIHDIMDSYINIERRMLRTDGNHPILRWDNNLEREGRKAMKRCVKCGNGIIASDALRDSGEKGKSANGNNGNKVSSDQNRH